MQSKWIARLTTDAGVIADVSTGVVLPTRCFVDSTQYDRELNAEVGRLMEERFASELGWTEVPGKQDLSRRYVSDDFRFALNYQGPAQAVLLAFTSSPDEVQDHYRAMRAAQSRPAGEAMVAAIGVCRECLARLYNWPEPTIDDDTPELQIATDAADYGSEPLVRGHIMRS